MSHLQSCSVKISKYSKSIAGIVQLKTGGGRGEGIHEVGQGSAKMSPIQSCIVKIIKEHCRFLTI